MRAMREMVIGGEPLLFDGAMGTEIYRRGVYINRCFEEANLGNRAMIQSIHRDYLEAGAEVLSTNSWGAGRLKLRSHNLQDSLRAINLEAARLAREVAGEGAYVAGSVGPLGARLEPWGRLSAPEAFDCFREQMEALREGGADCFLLETFVELGELEQALAAARAVDPSLPVIACLALDLAGELPFGPGLEAAIARLESLGADAVGLNCHVGPQPMLTAAKRLRGIAARPLLVQPNAGLPALVDGRTIYMSTPEYFAQYTRYFLQEGVTFVGGCCGTTPAHTKAMAQALRQARAMRVGAPAPEAPRSGITVTEREAKEAPRVPFAEKSKWSAKLARGEMVHTVELLPPAGIGAEKILESARAVKAAGLDAINIPDGPRASSRMSTIVTAILVEQRVGIETILHYTCRDRNLISMQSDMLGIQAIGLRNLLLVTGDPPKLGEYPDATGVFDVDAVGLARMVRRLNGGIDLGGKPIGEPTSISMGVGVNPVHRDFDHEMGRFRRKIEAGAEWAITQPVFDLRALERFIGHMRKNNLSLPIVIGIWPLTSLRNAQFMANEVPGIEIPESTMRRMAGAASAEAARDLGIAIAREMCEAMAGEVQGIQVSAPFGRVELALRVLGKA